MIITIAKMARELKIRTPDLITRPVGRQMYARTSEALSIIQEDETVLLDFEGIQVIDSSFIDEYIMKLLLRSRTDERPFFIKLANISDPAVINIESVFRSYHSINNRKIAVMTDRLIDKSYFIGLAEKEEKDIINYLNINKSASSRELSDFLQIDHSRTVSILDSMYGSRLIKKSIQASGPVYSSI